MQFVVNFIDLTIFGALMKSLSFAAAGFVVLVGSASAQTNTLPPYLSDELRISDPASGAVVLDTLLPEGIDAAGASLPETAVFNMPGVASGVVPIGTPPLSTPAALLPFVSNVVALLEPVGDPLDPGATPIYVSTPNGTRQLSDLVISFNNIPGSNGPAVALLSDGDGNLSKWNAALGGVYANAVDETGALQDMTPILKTPYTVQVASDVVAVPEPSTYGMLLAGLGIACAARRKSAKRS